MNHLDEISVEELQNALDDEKKPTRRLLAAIAYKKDVTQTKLAEWHGVQRRTIYNWLQRLDTDEPLEQAVSDVQRPGRTRKLSEAQQKALETILQDPPGKSRNRRTDLDASDRPRISKKPTMLNTQSRVVDDC